MKVIFKEEVCSTPSLGNKHRDFIHLRMPVGSRIIHFAEHKSTDTLCIWYECEDASEKILRRFWLVYTGEDYPGEREAVGTVILDGGHLVVHLIEQTR